MFHKASGKLFFVVVTVMFFVLSVQNTWGFLNKTMPSASPIFLGSMMIVFEAGFLGWLAMLMHGAENVYRVAISFIMLLITGLGVFTGAYYEMSGLMNTGIGYKVDPGVLAWVPFSVLMAYIATGVALVLYMIASPEFAHRMQHMNQTGQAPAMPFQLIPTNTVMLSQTHTTTGTLPQIPGPAANVAALPAGGQSSASQSAVPASSGTQPVAAPASQPVQASSSAASQPTLRGALAGALGKAASLVGGANQPAPATSPTQSQGVVESTAEPSDANQTGVQGGQQASAQRPTAEDLADALGNLERRLLDAFMHRPAAEQEAVLQYAAQHSLADLVAYLKKQYPKAAAIITAKRLQHVMRVWQALMAEAAAAEQARQAAQAAQAQSQAAQASRPRAARRQSANGTGTTTRKASTSKAASGSGGKQEILEALDAMSPGLSDAELAKKAQCSISTVIRWRAKQAQAAQAAQPVAVAQP